MGLYKRNKIWWLKFQIAGREVRTSTGCRSRKEALKVEAHVRDQIALGNWGIIERKPAPILGGFLKESFAPWLQVRYQNRNTRANYLLGARQLQESNLAAVAMDQITSEHTTKYVSDHAHMSNSGINQGLRTLQRALSLALEWGKITRKPAVKMLPEQRRERVLTFEEEDRYLAACPEPWRAIAVVMLDCGLRPEEAFTLRWEENFDWSRNILRVLKGKTKAAKRELVVSGRAIAELRQLLMESGDTGFVFPALGAKSKSGHVSQALLNKQHHEALRASGVAEFDPYSLRHTCLTRMGEYTPLPTLKVIAGHTRVEMTMRYVHPSKDSVEKAFAEAEIRYKSRHRAQIGLVQIGRKRK